MEATDHFLQIAAEQYFVYKCQHTLFEMDAYITDDVEEKKQKYINYIDSKNIIDKFNSSVYKKNIDKHVKNIIVSWIKRFNGKKINVVDKTVEFRNLGKKGDFIIEFEDGENISVSLKNYKKVGRIQLCSGTWNSNLMNFIFTKTGSPGQYKYNDIQFSGSNKIIRNQKLSLKGYECMIPCFDRMDKINTNIKQKYVYSDEGLNCKVYGFNNMFKKDSFDFSIEAIQCTMDSLNMLPKEDIKKRILEMSGLDNKEEILILWPNKYLFSLFNEKYKKFHIGNICETRFKDIWNSDKYWEVMNYLSSPKFNAQKMCASLCLQHKVNEVLDDHVKGKVKLEKPSGKEPDHISFI